MGGEDRGRYGTSPRAKAARLGESGCARRSSRARARCGWEGNERSGRFGGRRRPWAVWHLPSGQGREAGRVGLRPKVLAGQGPLRMGGGRGGEEARWWGCLPTLEFGVDRSIAMMSFLVEHVVSNHLHFLGGDGKDPSASLPAQRSGFTFGAVIPLSAGSALPLPDRLTECDRGVPGYESVKVTPRAVRRENIKVEIIGDFSDSSQYESFHCAPKDWCAAFRAPDDVNEDPTVRVCHGSSRGLFVW